MLVEVKLFFEDMKANGAADRTLVNYEKWINKFLNTLEIKKSSQLLAIKKQDIQSYRLKLEEDGMSDNTLNTYTAPILSLFNFLYNEDYIENNPAKGVKVRKIPKKPMVYLTEKEAKSLIRHCNSKRQKAMFYLMINTGLRISEVIELTMSDLVDGKIYINDAKRGETRYIPISLTCSRFIREYIGTKESVMLNGEVRFDNNGDKVYSDGERVPPVIPRMADKNYLFTSNTGAKCDPANVNKQLKAICKKAHIDKDVSCHKLRATAATLQSIHGTNMKNIQTMLGHQSSQMTARYVQMVDKNYRDEVTNNGLLEGIE